MFKKWEVIIIDIIYFGNIGDEELIRKDEKMNKQTYKMAQYNYEKAFCDEMCKINNIKIISLFQQEYFPKRKLFFFRKKHKYMNKEIEYIKYINIPFLKEFIYFIGTCIKIFYWNMNTSKANEKCIFLNLNYAPVSLAIVLMGKLFRIKKVITFTDLLSYTYADEKVKKMPIYKRCLIKPYIYLIKKLQENYDMYIFFSELMNECINKFNKPYLVMEGIYNPEGINFKKVKKSNAIAYAGKLNREIGIQKILDVFKKINDKNLELWFLGNGDMKDEIKKASIINKNIKYFGYKNRQEVFEYLKMAKILINLRNPKDEYTKYSFPSKNFEYMVSASAVVTTRLEGTPKEYEKYMYVVEYDDDKIVKKIKELLNSDNIEIYNFGQRAREFILKNKNPYVQVKKIDQFLKNNMK